MTTRVERRTRSSSLRTRVAALAVLAVAAQAGCGREFFREWANQDASEAIFEKSRDPRWRLDLFSIDPPALARYADPYDPDRPPAPPDDRAAEATSPVPQWPNNRLIVPAEGTAYLDMLEAWTRQRADSSGYDPNNAPPAPRGAAPNAPAASSAGGAYSGTTSPPTPPSTGSGSPFQAPPSNPPMGAPPTGDAPPPANSGPARGGLTPIPVPDATPNGPTATPPAVDQPQPQAQGPGKPRDVGVMLSAFQQSGLPIPVTPGDPAQAPPPNPGPPPIGLDPNPTDLDLNQPVNRRPDLSPDQDRVKEGLASEITSNLVPKPIDFNDAEAAGLPANSRPYVINMAQAFTLALINARAYQTNLENVYASALAVTLQRFAFTPQFYAGLSPSQGVALGAGPSPGGGFPPPNLANQFLYSTAETGSQVSALNLGTAAGVGKVFQSGARVLAGFASQVIFNFAGRNGSQPTVRSFLPLTLVQPFLRGGGRAVTLEPLTQAERNLLYAIRSFAKFRQEFIVATLVGGSVVTNLGVPAAAQGVGFSGAGNSDPAVGFINVIEDIQLVENARRNIAAFEQYRAVYAELIKGESSGLTQLQLDQVDQQLQNARQQLVNSRNTYRRDLDQFKVQMGLPPDTPLILDRSLVRVFKDVYDAVDEWQRNPKRDLRELPKFADRLPELPDVVIDGRSVLAVYNEGKDNEDKLEDLLLAAERVALEHRLDLMNARAQLYDSWRAIKVQANALMGVLNISLTNTILTPPTTNNPFGFVDQAKSFSLVLNGELPLVRLNERNNFRTALINYQRQRRSLQSTEDTIKFTIRDAIRNMQAQYLTYEIAKRNFVLLIRQKDQSFEQIIAPPAGAAGAGSASGAVQTNNLTSAQGQLINVENNLISSWYSYTSARLFLFRDLGTLPYDEWEAFRELFPEEPISTDADAAARGAGATRAAATRSEPPAAPGGNR